MTKWQTGVIVVEGYYSPLRLLIENCKEEIKKKTLDSSIQKYNEKPKVFSCIV